MKILIGRYPRYNKKTGKTPDRKISVRIDKWDTWNLDHTLALIILPCLKQLKKTTHGSPNTDDEDVPVKLRSTSGPKKKNEWDIDKNHFKRWDWIMGEMIWAFEQELDEKADMKFHTGKMELLWQPVGKDGKNIGKPLKWGSKKDVKLPEGTVYKTVKGPNDTHKYDRKAADKFYARQQNGFRLLGKYYRNLWD